MNKLQMKMQFASMVLFTVLFGAVFMTSITAGTQSKVEEKADEPRDAPAIIVKAETETVTSAVMEEKTEQPQEQQEITAEYVYYDVPLADELQQYIQDVCKEYDFDRYDIIVALIQKESSFNETAVSDTSDYGYMQINKCNHEWLSDELGIDDYLDGEQNITAGVYLLSGLYDKYEDIGLTLMAYNCGEKGAKDLWQQGIYSTGYSRSIIEAAASLDKR